MRVDRYNELYESFRWDVPERYNIAHGCCGRWAGERSRFALYWEDESGAAAAYSFWDIQMAANRLSNALAALGVKRGDRVAILLPQRPETAIAYVAIFQMGAIALPLSHLFGPEALEYRLEHAGASVAIVEPTTLPNLWAIKDRLGRLRHVIGVGGARESSVLPWEGLLEKAKAEFECVDTKAEDPSLIIYTSGTTGAPKGRCTRTASSSAISRASCTRTTSFRRKAMCSGRPRTGPGRAASSTRCCRAGISASRSSATAASSNPRRRITCSRNTAFETPSSSRRP